MAAGSGAPTRSASPVGKVVAKYKVGKHFALANTGSSLTFEVNEKSGWG